MAKKAIKEKKETVDPIATIETAILADFPDATFSTVNIRTNVPTPDGTTHYMATFVSQQQLKMSEYLVDNTTGNIVARI